MINEKIQFEEILESIEYFNDFDYIEEGIIKKIKNKEKLSKAETVALTVGGIVLAIPILTIGIPGILGYLKLSDIKYKMKNKHKNGELSEYSLYDIIETNRNKIAKVEYPKDLGKYVNEYKKHVKEIGELSKKYRKIFQSANDKNYKNIAIKMVDIGEQISSKRMIAIKNLDNISNNFSSENISVDNINNAKEVNELLNIVDDLVNKYFALLHQDDWIYCMDTKKLFDFNNNELEENLLTDDAFKNFDYRMPCNDLNSLYDNLDYKVFNKIKFYIKD